DGEGGGGGGFVHGEVAQAELNRLQFDRTHVNRVAADPIGAALIGARGRRELGVARVHHRTHGGGQVGLGGAAVVGQGAELGVLVEDGAALVGDVGLAGRFDQRVADGEAGRRSMAHVVTVGGGVIGDNRMIDIKRDGRDIDAPATLGGGIRGDGGVADGAGCVGGSEKPHAPTVLRLVARDGAVLDDAVFEVEYSDPAAT